MVGTYYICKLPAEKQHIHPQTEYYGIHFEGENGTYQLVNIIKKDLPTLGIAAANHRSLYGEMILDLVPEYIELTKSRTHAEKHLKIRLDSLIQIHHSLEPLSAEELKTAGIEHIVIR